MGRMLESDFGISKNQSTRLIEMSYFCGKSALSTDGSRKMSKNPFDRKKPQEFENNCSFHKLVCI